MRDLSVLIADDSPAALRSLRLLVSELPGFTVPGEAADGKEALAKALCIAPAVLIADIRMPILDGLSLAAHIRKRALRTEVVIVSGYAEFEYAQKAMRHGVREYLLKPIVRSQFTAALERIRAGLGEGVPREAEDGAPEGAAAGIREALRYVQQHCFRADLCLTEVADRHGYSPAHFSRLFKAAIGVGYAEHVTRLRLDNAVRLLADPAARVREIAWRCGYSSYSHFEKVFCRHFGMTPTEYRKKGHETAKKDTRPDRPAGP